MPLATLVSASQPPSSQPMLNASAPPILSNGRKRFFIVHGGPPCSKDGVTLDEIEKIPRIGQQPGQQGLMCEMLWTDPQEQPGRGPSKRVSTYVDLADPRASVSALDPTSLDDGVPIHPSLPSFAHTRSARTESPANTMGSVGPSSAVPITAIRPATREDGSPLVIRGTLRRIHSKRSRIPMSSPWRIRTCSI